MKVVLDNIKKVEYQDSLTKGRLSNIHVIFGPPGHILNFYGPGLRLALALLRDQFPPKTEPEQSLIDRPVPTPLDFEFNAETLELSVAYEKLKNVGYIKLLAAEQQAEQFSHLSSGGRTFNVASLRLAIQREIHAAKPSV